MAGFTGLTLQFHMEDELTQISGPTFPTPGLKTASGEQVFLFSSRHPKTVQRHFHWMAEHGVDGAFLQRFASQCDVENGDEGIRKIRDEVGERVREAAEKEGRTFAIMYDVSGVSADRVQGILERDWGYLIRNQGVLDSPNYLREKGKAVVALWGFGFENARHTPALVRAITAHFRNVTPGGVYIMAGTPAHWRTAESDADRNPDFLDVWLNEFDAISPWTVGRYRDEREADDFAETKIKGDVELIRKRNEEGRWRKIDYIPVVLPGGSGFNLSQGKWGFNDIKRNGGRFLWQQIFNAKHLGVRTMYGAMWDEYDEGTAFLPVVEKKSMVPVSDKHPFLALDEDGYDLPSDWYMRICGFAAEGLHGERRIFESFPSKELQDYWSSRPKYEDVDPKSGDFVSGVSKATTDGGSGDGGQSYQDWLAAQKTEDRDEPPPPPYSLEAEEGPHPSVAGTAALGAQLSTVTTPGPPSSASTFAASLASTAPTQAIPTAQNQSYAPPTRQATVPPPVNSGSRPQQDFASPSPAASLSSSASSHDRTSTQGVSTSSPHAPTLSIGTTNNSTPPVGHSVQDPVASLMNDFSRHGLGPSDARRTSSPPPPSHATRPQTHASLSRPSTSGSHSQSQASAPQSSRPGASGQWPPPEWGINNDPRHQSPPLANQSTRPGHISAASNLSRPQPLSSPNHTSPSPPLPALNTKPSYPPSGAAGHAPGGSYISTPSAGAPPFPGTQTSHANGGSASSYPSASTYQGQIQSSSSYGPSGYTPSAPHGLGYGGSPHVSPPQSPTPGASYYPGQTPGHGFPVAQGSSYPGSNSYGVGPPPMVSQPPYGPPPVMGYPSNGGGGFHLPTAPSGNNYYGGPQPQPSVYSPGYVGGSAPYGSLNTMPSPSSSWHLGPGGPTHPIHPGRPTTPYSNTPNPGPWVPAPSSSGLLDTALNAVDRVAGKKTRDQLESVAQSYGKKVQGTFGNSKDSVFPFVFQHYRPHGDPATTLITLR
ncbi:hypothetical protein H0H92_008077 [Tricholoma furcatifolium]|nr:hypothetical protein H0H92_008077 [Tricholoma furcatifolium]